jgi:lipopolysaccharide biosynthesis glycosyltransferase
MDPIEIVMAVDPEYVRQLAVALASISANGDDPCRVHVLHDDVSLTDRDRVQRSLSDRVEVVWMDARPAVVDHDLPRVHPRPMFFRLVASELLPPELDRVIYLDADVIVRRPLRELWRTPLGDAPVGAVRDAYHPWMARNTRFHWRDVHVAPESPFFNSGVMLLALAQWRDRDIGARALALLSETSSMFDQCALNIVVEGEWMALPPQWNVQSYHLSGDECLAYASEGRERIDAAIHDPAIVHFTGGTFNRPWQAPCSNPYRDEWLAQLDRTPWNGWRPEPKPAVVRAWGRTQRAFRVLRYGGGTDVKSRPRHE